MPTAGISAPLHSLNFGMLGEDISPCYLDKVRFLLSGERTSQGRIDDLGPLSSSFIVGPRPCGPVDRLRRLPVTFSQVELSEFSGALLLETVAVLYPSCYHRKMVISCMNFAHNYPSFNLAKS